MPQKVNEKTVRKLLAEGVAQREIARRLNIPRSSLQRLIKEWDAPPLPKPLTADGSGGLPVVDARQLTPAEVEAVRSDFWEVIEWWRERKLQRVHQSQPRETARATFHVEKRYIRLIHREAEVEGVSIAEVVNRAFLVYFEKK